MISTKFDENGHEVAQATLTAAGEPPLKLYVKPSKAIPIVFVPGIMGSPLKAIDKSPIKERDYQWAWFPDDLKWLGGTIPRATGFILKKYRSGFSYLTPKEKSKMLTIDNTKVPQPKEADLYGMSYWRDSYEKYAQYSDSEYLCRGWGSVVLGEYGYANILLYLDYVLNNIFTMGKVTDLWHDIVKKINKFLIDQEIKSPLKKEDIEKLGEWYFPVYAAGYNWLESNAVSAKQLSGKITDIIKDCNERLRYNCDKVILVTHSMGGLVARSCAKNYSDKIMGIIHGVQPINGAASAYHRVAAGWDGQVGLVLGKQAKDLTPIFANPGPLQLLPNKQYGLNWLTITTYIEENKKRSPILSLPLKNPYAEIYNDTTSWWKVVEPELVMPEGNADNGKKFYLENIKMAEIFHDNINNYFHKETYLYYGKGESYKTWYKIDISVDSSNYLTIEEILTAKLHDNYSYYTNGGTISLKNGEYANVSLSQKDDCGDGTVPSSSMHTSYLREKVKKVMVIDNIEHSASYNDECSQLATLYGICNIINQENDYE